jgi:hypothetical protein
MQIAAYVNSIGSDGATQLTVGVDIHFYKDGTNHDLSTISLTGIGSLTDRVLCNSAIATAVSDYVNSNYGTSTTGINVTLFGGAVLPIAL